MTLSSNFIPPLGPLPVEPDPINSSQLIIFRETSPLPRTTQIQLDSELAVNLRARLPVCSISNEVYAVGRARVALRPLQRFQREFSPDPRLQHLPSLLVLGACATFLRPLVPTWSLCLYLICRIRESYPTARLPGLE